MKKIPSPAYDYAYRNRKKIVKAFNNSDAKQFKRFLKTYLLDKGLFEKQVSWFLFSEHFDTFKASVFKDIKKRVTGKRNSTEEKLITIAKGKTESEIRDEVVEKINARLKSIPKDNTALVELYIPVEVPQEEPKSLAEEFKTDGVLKNTIFIITATAALLACLILTYILFTN
jgi:predicted DNA-binding protein YlxM (UPF0122 family)